jgi:hypothetical protein
MSYRTQLTISTSLPNFSLLIIGLAQLLLIQKQMGPLQNIQIQVFRMAPDLFLQVSLHSG